MKKILLVTLTVLLSLNAQALFEVKDESDHSVFEITDDGIRIFNYPDTLMIISATEIRANLDNSTKGLSRSFSVSTSATGKGTLANVLEITTDSTKIGTGSTTMGRGSGRYTDFSIQNIFIGKNAGFATTPGVPLSYSGTDNVFIGNNSAYSNSSGSWNVFIGMNSGYLNSTGKQNAFVGEGSGYSNTIGTSNVFIGNQAGYNNTDQDMNTYMGSNAGYSATGAGNTYVGCISGYYSRAGISNSFFGDNSGIYNDDGNYNSLFGSYSGHNNDGGSNNTIMGYAAGHGSTSSSVYNDNCIFGYYAGVSLLSGSSNVMIGFRSGTSCQDGTGNIFLGNQSGYSETGSNKLYIDNLDTTTPLIYGEFDNDLLTFNTDKALVKHPMGQETNGLFIQTTYNGNTDSWHFYQSTGDNLTLWYNTTLRGTWNLTSGVYTSSSDKKFKKNIEELAKVMDKVMLLQPKKYNFISQKNNDDKHIGLIAQDVEKLFPEFVMYNEEADAYTMDYAGLSVIAIQAIKELKQENDELKERLNKIEESINDIKKSK